VNPLQTLVPHWHGRRKLWLSHALDALKNLCIRHLGADRFSSSDLPLGKAQRNGRQTAWTRTNLARNFNASEERNPTKGRLCRNFRGTVYYGIRCAVLGGVGCLPQHGITRDMLEHLLFSPGGSGNPFVRRQEKKMAGRGRLYQVVEISREFAHCHQKL